MAREVRLENQDSPIAYKLKAILYHHERHQREYPVFVSGSTIPIDGHFLVHANQKQNDSVIEEIVGIAHSEEELPDKVYKCALEIGRKYAEQLRCIFVDETSRAKESPLTKA